MEVTGALVGAEAVHRAGATSVLAEATLGEVVRADGMGVVLGRDAFEDASELVGEPGELGADCLEGCGPLIEGGGIDDSVDGGHQTRPLAGVFVARVALSEPLRGIVLEVPDAALELDARQGHGNGGLDCLVAVADDGEGRVVTADAQVDPRLLPGFSGCGRL